MRSTITVSRTRYRPRLLATALLCAVAGLAASSALFSHTAGTAASSSASGIYLGVWQPGAPGNMSALATFERDAGKSAAIVAWYQGWGAANAALDLTALKAVAAHGSLPLITWESWDYTLGTNQPAYSLANIIAGHFDAYVQSWAQGLAAYGRPVLLRWGHEMNLGRYPWAIGVNGNTAEQYVAAWQHLHSLFTSAGARNVQWVWGPGLAWNAATAFDAAFPGDAVVDWVGLDVFNNVAWGGWQTFAQLLAPSYAGLLRLSTRPVILPELASAEAGGNKATWITAAMQAMPSQFPRVAAFVWFNEDATSSLGVDWRIESSRSAQKAYSRAIQPSLFRSTWP